MGPDLRVGMDMGGKHYESLQFRDGIWTWQLWMTWHREKDIEFEERVAGGT